MVDGEMHKVNDEVGAGSCADIGAQCVQYALHVEFGGR